MNAKELDAVYRNTRMMPYISVLGFLLPVVLLVALPLTWFAMSARRKALVFDVGGNLELRMKKRFVQVNGWYLWIPTATALAFLAFVWVHILQFR